MSKETFNNRVDHIRKQLLVYMGLDKKLKMEEALGEAKKRIKEGDKTEPKKFVSFFRDLMEEGEIENLKFILAPLLKEDEEYSFEQLLDMANQQRGTRLCQADSERILQVPRRMKK